MFLLSLTALGAEGLWDGLDERTVEAVSKLKLTVDGAWANGSNVVVDLTVSRFDRMLDTRFMTLDGDRPPTLQSCLTRDGDYAYCWVDEGRRRVRIQFDTPAAIGTHTLHWFGSEVATFEVKTGAGAPAFPLTDLQVEREMDFRVPESFGVRGLEEFVDDERPAAPGRRWVVVDSVFTGAPPSLLGGSLQLAAGDVLLESVVEECRTKKGPLGTCEPLPERGEMRSVFSVPLGAEEVQVTFGDVPLGESVELVDALPVAELTVASIQALPVVPDADPLTPIRAWMADFDGRRLWADFQIDGPLSPTPYLLPNDPVAGISLGYGPEVECYAVDPGEAIADPVDCADGAYLRASWHVQEDPTEVILVSNGRAVGDILAVATSGPVFSDRMVGLFHVGRGESGLAVGPLERAAAADSGDVVVLAGLAISYDDMGPPELALQWAERALALPGAERDILFEIAGRNAAWLERYDEAEALLARGLDELPGAPGLQLALGRVHRAQDEFPAAERWLLRAARTDHSGDAFRELSEVMLVQNERSMAVLALVRARLEMSYHPDSGAVSAEILDQVTQPTIWSGGSTQRGPLSVISPLRVSSKEREVGQAQVAYLMLAWAKAGQAGRKSERLRNDPWYTHVTGLVERIVEEDLTEAAAWIMVVEPGEWPIYQNVAAERVFRLVREYEAQVAR